MRWTTFVAQLLLSAEAVSAGRSLRHAGKNFEEQARRALGLGAVSSRVNRPPLPLERRADTPSFLNANTSRFVVNGSNIPDVDFDVGESYAGLLPISADKGEQNQLYFWFFPSRNPAAEKEILIWLNGGPGCSSLEGIIQENGPFLWQYGTYRPVENPWSWHKLTNVIWVDQPVGTGFSVGKPTARNEDDVAAQFKGFWKNFVDTFGLQGYKVYIAGESYAGTYCPYIASAFLDAKDKTYYNMSGMMIYDPVLTWDDVQTSIPALSFVEYWGGLFPFNDTFREQLRGRDKSCGYTDWLNKYLVYPPRGPIPMPLPGTDGAGRTRAECRNLFWDIFAAASTLNPCFDIYQVATTCPLLWDVLGFPGSLEYLPEGATIYFDRADVKAAINAPRNVSWAECTDDDVFVDGVDRSPPSALSVLPGVIERTGNVIIGHGALDMVLLANGTLLAIQNMTWGGQTGFQTRPSGSFYVPYHGQASLATLAGAGVFGTAHSERGLTYVGVDLSGHMIPQYAPAAAFRHLEALLGRIPGLDSTAPFTTDANVAQSSQPLGSGTAPQGWSSYGSGSAYRRRRGVTGLGFS
ncbi:hypothetical protein VTK73DRAFT_7858 [Phialemonium thermophilum]|uniref:Carboxypeptidase n=1 Tax=Phialemonium thermophilum TaxID=223376 RepID=A0ABR3WC93_9PEZI